jgi:hypothetical protein
MRSVCCFAAGLLCLAAASAKAQVYGATQPCPQPAVLLAGSSFYDAGGTSGGADCGCSTEGCGVAGCTDGCDACGGGVCGSCNGCACNGGCCCNSGWCNLGEAIVLWDLLHPCCEPVITIAGWTSAGYHSENTPLSNTPGDRLAFNDVPDRLNVHQAWLYAEKVASTDGNGADWGFRADVMYGTDGHTTQAFGNPAGSWDFQNGFDHGVYEWAIPQLYGELAVNDIAVKVGHFFTPAGYEVVPATGNFFYSHALTHYNSEPFTHTGALATYTGYEDVTFYGGWTAGWDSGFDSVNSGSNVVAGLAVMPSDDVTVTYIATAGNLGARGDDAETHHLVGSFTVTEKISYVLQSDLLRVDSTQDDDLGLTNYMFYAVNDCVKLGGRIEWWKDDGISYYEATTGVNIRPHANFVVRPEIRYDWTPTSTDANLRYTDRNRTTFGVDAILTF